MRGPDAKRNLVSNWLAVHGWNDRVAQGAAPTPVHVVTPAMVRCAATIDRMLRPRLTPHEAGGCTQRAAAVTGASDAVRRTVRRLLTNGYDASQLIMTRGMKDCTASTPRSGTAGHRVLTRSPLCLNERTA